MHPHVVLFILAALLSQTATAWSADEASLRVSLDQARILRIAHPAETVVIGNPAIADIAIHDAQTLVLTGRSYGTTNVVVLGKDGDVILDDRITVGSSEAGTLRVYRQAARETFSCSPECEPRLTIGDSPVPFVGAKEQFEDREKIVGASAGGGTASAN